MSILTRSAFLAASKVVVVVAFCSLSTQGGVPHGWFLAGNKPASYDSGIDTQAAYNGRASAYLKSKETHIEGFGTLMQSFGASHYLGKRVRFSAFVRAKDAQGWAGLWMRIDKETTQLAFDNMENRPIKGTADWQKYDVVLDIPKEATGIFFGILLSGTGEVWISNASFEVVASDVPTSGTGVPQMPVEPTNLSFED